MKGGRVQTAKTVVGYAWAACALLIVLACFIKMDYFSHRLAAATGVTISPWFSGGEVVQTTEHGAYRTLIHRPVFDGLLMERRDGFVQIDWEPTATLPVRIEEAIDYDGDGKMDFVVALNTGNGRAALSSRSASVVGIEGTFKLTKGWAARILLRRQG